MLSRLAIVIIAGAALAGLAACGFGHTDYVSIRGVGRPGGHATPDVAVLSPPCRQNPGLAVVGMETAPMARALGWFRITVQEQVSGVRVTESGVMRTTEGTLMAGDIRLGGHAPGWGSEGMPRAVRLVLLNGRFYLRAYGVPGPVPGKSWLTFSVGDLRKPAMAQARRFVGSAGFLRSPADHWSIFDLLSCSARSGGMRRVTLSGVPVSRYAGSLTLGHATAADPTLKRLSVLGARTVSWALWVNPANGLPRRLLMMAATAPNGHVTIDETFSGWGVPVAIRPPPPSQVATVSELKSSQSVAAQNSPALRLRATSTRGASRVPLLVHRRGR